MVQILPNGIGESRRVNTFNISQKIIRMHGMQPVGRETFLWKSEILKVTIQLALQTTAAASTCRSSGSGKSMALISGS